MNSIMSNQPLNTLQKTFRTAEELKSGLMVATIMEISGMESRKVKAFTSGLMAPSIQASGRTMR